MPDEEVKEQESRFEEEKRNRLLEHEWTSQTVNTKQTADTQEIHNTTRPDSNWPEEWPKLSKKRREETESWDEEEMRLQETRPKRGFFDVAPEDVPEVGCSGIPVVMPITAAQGNLKLR